MRKGVIVKKSKIHKKGVFAARNFKKGEIVMKWQPIILDKYKFERLTENQKDFTYKIASNKYFLMQPPEKFVNHSCDPNTHVKRNCDIAIRKIYKGEEISTDYGKSNPDSFNCKCGSKNCRNKIN